MDSRAVYEEELDNKEAASILRLNLSGEDLGMGLLKAVTTGNARRAKAFLRAGADPDYGYSRYGQSRTALHCAAGTGNLAMCELLLNAGADPVVEDERGLTPIDEARNAGYNVVGQLISKHAASDLSTATPTARTALSAMHTPAPPVTQVPRAGRATVPGGGGAAAGGIAGGVRKKRRFGPGKPSAAPSSDSSDTSSGYSAHRNNKSDSNYSNSSEPLPSKVDAQQAVSAFRALADCYADDEQGAVADIAREDQKERAFQVLERMDPRAITLATALIFQEWETEGRKRKSTEMEVQSAHVRGEGGNKADEHANMGVPQSNKENQGGSNCSY